MQLTVEYEGHFTLPELEARLVDTEARIGEIADIRGIRHQNENWTVATFTLFKDPGPVLEVKLEGEDASEGKRLQLAGTAYVAGDVKVVKINR